MVQSNDIQAVRVAPRRFTSTAPECSSCEKRVYAAEQVIGPGGRPYHKSCLKCTDCKKTLDALHLTEHEGDPYCKQCHVKNFGIEGYGRGGGTRANYTDRFSPSPYNSPASYKAAWSPRSNNIADEGDLPRTVSLEKALLVDNERSNGTSSKSSTDQIGTEEDGWLPPSQKLPPAAAYSSGLSPERKYNSSWSQTTQKTSTTLRPDSPVTSESTTNSSSSGAPRLPGINALKSFETNGNSADLCRRCGDVVYFAERILAAGHKWHKRCLRCGFCSRPLDSHLVVADDVPYCKKCYSEKKGIAEQGYVLRPNMY